MKIIFDCDNTMEVKGCDVLQLGRYGRRLPCKSQAV